jgi:hypothetical protein
LRHTKQPFVVEVKRHRGRGGSSSEKNLFSLAARVEALAEPAISHPAFNAFAAEPRKELARPMGRVLPSLDEPVPAPEPLPEEERPRRRGRIPRSIASEAGRAEDAAPPRRRGRKPKLAAVGAVDASPERAQAQAPSPARAPLPRETPAVAKAEQRKTPAAPKARAPAPRPVEPPRAPEAILRPEPQPPREPGEATRRRRSIMGRYVFGTELRLGERWKKRLRRGE